MRFDFWNNPLVVTAMRLRYRRSSPGMTGSIYAALLLCLAYTIHYFRAEFSSPPERLFLFWALTLQFGISGIVAMFAVAGSISTEVVSRTLDFQRIVSLSPRQILLGKMIGEPCVSYFAACAAAPLLVIACLLGAASFSFLFLILVQLVTFTLMIASIGLLHPLKVVEQKPSAFGRPGQGAAGAMIGLSFFAIPNLIANTGSVMQNPWLALTVGSITPIPALRGLLEGDPWRYQLNCWNLELPQPVFAPFVQLAVCWTCLSIMSRRLRNPIDTPLPKIGAYLGIMVIDFLAVGILTWQMPAGKSLADLAANLWLGHIIIGQVLLSLATPGLETLDSWIWRLKGEQSWWRDALIGERTDVRIATLVMLAIGWLFQFVLIAVWQAVAGNVTSTNLGQLASIGYGASVVAITIGWLAQTATAYMRKSAWAIFVLLLAILLLLPLLSGAIINSLPNQYNELVAWGPTILGLSPIGQYVAIALPNRSFDSASIAGVIPFFFVLYTILALVFWFLIRLWHIVHQRMIEAKRSQLKADR